MGRYQSIGYHVADESNMNHIVQLRPLSVGEIERLVEFYLSDEVVIPDGSIPIFTFTALAGNDVMVSIYTRTNDGLPSLFAAARRRIKFDVDSNIVDYIYSNHITSSIIPNFEVYEKMKRL